MEKRKFTREFKLEAVKLITERGVKVALALLFTPSIFPVDPFGRLIAHL